MLVVFSDFMIGYVSLQFRLERFKAKAVSKVANYIYIISATYIIDIKPYLAEIKNPSLTMYDKI